MKWYSISHITSHSVHPEVTFIINLRNPFLHATHRSSRSYYPSTKAHIHTNSSNKLYMLYFSLKSPIYQSDVTNYWPVLSHIANHSVNPEVTSILFATLFSMQHTISYKLFLQRNISYRYRPLELITCPRWDYWSTVSMPQSPIQKEGKHTSLQHGGVLDEISHVLVLLVVNDIRNSMAK